MLAAIYIFMIILMKKPDINLQTSKCRYYVSRNSLKNQFSGFGLPTSVFLPPAD
jgi:hypothetical protein